MNPAESSLLRIAATTMLGLCSPAVGQCSQNWQPGDAIPTAHGAVVATTVWDPDGAGPAPALLVAGGKFGAGSMLTTALASFDGANWAALGAPPMPEASALTVWNGLLVAAGGTGSLHTIATWNGTTWSTIGTVAGRVNAMTAFNGDLVVGGSFPLVTGVTTHNLARWNGTAWSDPGGGVNAEVRALAVFGSLWVGGDFTQAGPLGVSRLALWSGTSWSAGASFNAPIHSLAVRTGLTAASSFVFAGGDFTSVAGVAAQHIARFTSSTAAWTAIPGLPGSACRVVHVRGTSSTTFVLHAAVIDPASSLKVWRLNGTSWASLGSVDDVFDPNPTSLTFFNGQYVASFAADPAINAVLTKAVQIHDGTSWAPATGPGFDGPIRVVAARGNEIVVAGEFTKYGTGTLTRIARGGPGAWQALGTGIGGGIGVLALCTLPNGDVVAAGDFTTAGGVAVQNIARWDGNNWLPLGSGLGFTVNALLTLPNGHLIAAGDFTTAGGIAANHIARWNGSNWLPLGSGLNSTAYCLGQLANGDLVVGGTFTVAGGVNANRIARWNGLFWSALGGGVDGSVFALTVLPDDHVIVGGNFNSANGVLSPHVARWGGSAWLTQSTPTSAWDHDVFTLQALPNGDYFGGGATSFFGLGGVFGGSDANLARHSGGSSSLSWQAFDLLADYVVGSTVMPNGDVVVVGDFDGAGGLASHNVAVLRPTCPANVASHGNGCTGTGGPEVLSGTALPWTGSAFRGFATGMPANSFAIAVTGFTPLSLPMPAVLPQGLPGCTLLVSPDLLELLLPIGGTVTTQVALPNTLALGGQLFYQQVVPLEFGPAGNLAVVTGSNGLTLTIGVL